MESLNVLAESLRDLLKKFIDFFHIFDLSFFISGFATLSVLIFWGINKNLIKSLEFININYNLLYIIGLCYICGLISFSIGRFLRKEVYYRVLTPDVKDFCDLEIRGYNNFLKYHFKKYCNVGSDDSIINKEYVKYWAELRENKNHLNSFELISRYWIKTAIFDGLSFSFLTSIIVILNIKKSIIVYYKFSPIEFDILLFIIFICFITCIRQASVYFKYQIAEVCVLNEMNKKEDKTENN